MLDRVQTPFVVFQGHTESINAMAFLNGRLYTAAASAARRWSSHQVAAEDESIRRCTCHVDVLANRC